ncbi:MAG: hypothetical protein F6K35_38115 [Okeania sp. SIO2H7]|nr:hypothetical protein [Okeania sp. SIO2H7]
MYRLPGDKNAIALFSPPGDREAIFVENRRKLMKQTILESNHTAITPVLNFNPTETIVFLPRNGSRPTYFKLSEKMQLGSIVSKFSETQMAIAATYVLDYGFRFLELEEICAFVAIDDRDANQEMRDRLKMSWEGIVSIDLGNLWCYYSLTKEAYLNQGRFPLEFHLRVGLY